MGCGAWFHAAIIAALAGWWYARSIPSKDVHADRLAGAALVALLLLWVLKLAARFLVRRRVGGPGPIAAREWGWATAAVLGVVGWSIGRTTLPQQIGLWTARPALERICGEDPRIRTRRLTPVEFASWYAISSVETVWLEVQDAPPDGWHEPRADALIIQVVDRAWLDRYAPSIDLPEASLQGWSTSPSDSGENVPGRRLLRATLLEVAQASWIHRGFWARIDDGPDTLRDGDVRWRRIAGSWYAVEVVPTASVDPTPGIKEP